jgi:hypothetical protein
MKIFSLRNLTAFSLVVKPFVSPKSRLSPLEMKLYAKWKKVVLDQADLNSKHALMVIRRSGYQVVGIRI